MKNPIDKMWEWVDDRHDLYSSFGRLVLVGVGLYVLFFPITIPISIYYALTDKTKPYVPPEPIVETEEHRIEREARAAKFKFKKIYKKEI
jgi:hypothetical protein